MANYIYSESGDFSNGVNLTCLDKSIEEYGFGTPFTGIIHEADVITIMFNGSLGTNDQDDLDIIITNHDPDNCAEESDIGTVIGAAGDAESLTQSSTNSTSPIRKLRMSMTDLPSGRYRIGWYYEWALGSASSDFRARVQINDTTDLMYQSQEAKDPGTDQSMPASGYAYIDLTEGNHDIDLDYWAESNTAYIKNARLEIWRAA